MTPVPFSDLDTVASEVRPEIKPEYPACLIAGGYRGGPPVDLFPAPGVTIAKDLYPGAGRSAALIAGPKIGSGAQIGVNVIIASVARAVPFERPAMVCRAVTELLVTDELKVTHGVPISRYRLIGAAEAGPP
jgi:hypothetical protein